MAFDADQCTYEFVKISMQEDHYPGEQLVFCKDMAYGLQGKYELLPKGYRHTFLIRNPYRAFPSHKKIFVGWMEGSALSNLGAWYSLRYCRCMLLSFGMSFIN